MPKESTQKGSSPKGASPTVAELSAIAGIDATVLNRGSKFETPVNMPHSVEFPQPGQWLRQGDLVMTSALLLGADEHHWEVFIGDLLSSDVAGLVIAIGPQLPLESVPDFLIGMARERDLSLISVSGEPSFATILRHVVDRVATSQRLLYQASFALQQRLTGIVTRGRGVDELLSGWLQATGQPAVVIDRVGRIVGRNSGVSAESAQVLGERVLEDPPSLGDSRRIDADGQSFEATAFAGETTVRGYLICGESDREEAVITVSSLRAMLALEYERRWFLSEVDRKRRAQNIARLQDIDGDRRAAYFLRNLGVDWTLIRGVVVSTESELRAEVVVDDLAYILATPLIRQQGRVVECLVGTDPTSAVTEFGLPDAVGIGTAVSPGNSAITLRQATSAMETSRKAGTPINYVDGASHRFLLQTADSEYRKAFSDAVLEPIESSANGEALLETLHMWLVENRSIEACAHRLNVHRHTVRNRVQKIAQLLARDLDSIDTQTELWLALKARGIGELS